MTSFTINKAPKLLNFSLIGENESQREHTMINWKAFVRELPSNCDHEERK